MSPCSREFYLEMIPKPVREIKQRNGFGNELSCLLFCQDLFGTQGSALSKDGFSCSYSLTIEVCWIQTTESYFYSIAMHLALRNTCM